MKDFTKPVKQKQFLVLSVLYLQGLYSIEKPLNLTACLEMSLNYDKIP